MTLRRDLLIARGWVQAVLIVVVAGFAVLGMLAWQTYEGMPPIPARVLTPDGQLIFTRDDLVAGQGVFLRNGLMEYGSIFGHGAYLGPDYTADYLHRAALSALNGYGGSQSSNAALATVQDFKTNRYDASTDTLTYSAAQARAFEELRQDYFRFFSNPTTQFGLRPGAIADAEDVRKLTAFFKGGGGHAPREKLFVYEQLASRAAG